ncbi:hypothetical protein QAD02_018479 [Eretmocerus hayati]|uniref:Uncharacterized protein n=2 Tax=Eretmocerus hayati TaxID=131215 RepID=A0ACC2PH53_9HYME|nr:hypothetical protein QAD02_000326 [Eretmocerus hayati]KAJ8682687.1 hypothetical protein QAD02_018479 [Eretmocerus hayati]
MQGDDTLITSNSKAEKISDKPLIKKPKNLDPSSSNPIESPLNLRESPANFIAPPAPPAMSTAQFEEFLDKTKGCSDIHQLLSEYKQDKEILIEMIDSAYAIAEGKSRKSRLTKVKNRLLGNKRSNSSDSQSSSRSIGSTQSQN